MDIYLFEAIINGLLLGGVLALLSLGLNLIFGVIDVIWICYAEVVMAAMYAVFWLYVEWHWPLLLACVAAKEREHPVGAAPDAPEAKYGRRWARGRRQRPVAFRAAP